jgi:hypothetical protein
MLMGRVVEESDLNSGRFHCCGDEDLYPFGCPECGRLMVFCYECDTLYTDLKNLKDQGAQVNFFEPGRPIFACPQCGYPFERFFIRDGLYKVSRERWLESGLGHLLEASSGAFVRPARMNEEDYWRALEMRVSREMADIEECKRLGMWCDGLIAHTFDLKSDPARIRGRAWIGFGSRQEAWTFDLLLPAAVSAREQIDWAQLLPADDVTAWLSVDLKRKHLVMAPADAIEDAVYFAEDHEGDPGDEDAIP